MKALFFDCSSGISGNMTLGALSELIEDPHYLINELAKLHIEGYHIEKTKTVKNGITGTYVDVVLDDVHHHHNHEHHHEHHHEHRNLFDVNHIIDESPFDDKVKQLAKDIFLRVAQAESKVHHMPLDQIHFHEVGAIDSIIDIIGTAILIQKINPDVIYSSVVCDGHGYIECAHGKMAVPVPATSEIFAASDVVFQQIDIDTELVTPTGAAIIATLATHFGPQPAMKVNKIGWGCGTKELAIPNVLKVSLGEIEENNQDIIVMETNIDDCSGEILAYTMEQLFAHGALDVFFTPIYMKKNRPAQRLTVSCLEKDMSKLKDVLFKETTTIGIRYRKENRFALKRQIVEKETEWGKVHFKCCQHDEEIYEYPEFEDVKKIALKTGLSIKEIMKKIS